MISLVIAIPRSFPTFMWELNVRKIDNFAFTYTQEKSKTPIQNRRITARRKARKRGVRIKQRKKRKRWSGLRKSFLFSFLHLSTIQFPIYPFHRNLMSLTKRL